MKQILIFLFTFMLFATDNRAQQRDVLTPAPFGSVKIGGYTGKKIDLCLANRVMAQDVDRVVIPFAERNDDSWGFRCEFWGKWFTSAMLGYGYAPTPEHKVVIDKAINGLLATATPDGYIGTYPYEHHLKHWDVWGRKYVLLGLIAYYDQTKETKALEAACREADFLIKEAGAESGVNLAATGWIGWKGLAPCSVLEPVALLYQRTGEQRYLDFAEYIISLWNTPNELTPTGIRLIQDAIEGKPMWEVGGVPKAYEMMSCFEGLCEMYRITGNKLYFDACQSVINSIIRDEIMIVGSGSIHEIWCHGKHRQNAPFFQGLETCVTVTWMKFLFQMLRLTGDSRYADELEKTLYNALFASQTPDGEWWSYYTGLMGERAPSHLQFADVVMSCCVANGPRAMMLTPSWALMTAADGLTINLYAPLTASLSTPGKQTLTVSLETEYPVKEDVTINLKLQKREKFAVKLRIPEWSKNTSVIINGKQYEGLVIPGSYASIERTWNDGDKITLKTDLKAFVADAPSGDNDAAIQRGPIVLSFDTRLVPARDGVETPPMYRYKFLKNPENGSIDIQPVVTSEIPDIWMTFNVPVTDEGGGKHYLPMCDYSSAGNTWQNGNLFRVWIPQPFDFRHLYINNLNWNINVTSGSKPEIPELYKINVQQLSPQINF